MFFWFENINLLLKEFGVCAKSDRTVDSLTMDDIKNTRALRERANAGLLKITSIFFETRCIFTDGASETGENY